MSPLGRRRLLGAVVLCLLAVPALAAVSPVQIAAAPITLGGKDEMSSALRVFLLLTALSLVPAALICMTSFVRIVVVLSMLRHAIGLQDTPPNVVVVSLALFLTLFSMSPVIEQINQAAVQPYAAGRADLQQAVERGKAPLKEFMVRQTRESDVLLMVELANAAAPQSLDDVQLVHLVPAFMLSELRTAFQIGFVIFLPFLLIDIVVASALMALGMMMVPPSTIAIPVKILLFVLIDGWALVVKSLMGTFA
ncbi:flagellar type III secretion system pore protein FliP [Rhizobacter sp. P5_C2]